MGYSKTNETILELKFWRNELISSGAERDAEGIRFAWQMLDSILDEYLNHKLSYIVSPTPTEMERSLMALPGRSDAHSVGV